MAGFLRDAMLGLLISCIVGVAVGFLSLVVWCWAVILGMPEAYLIKAIMWTGIAAGSFMFIYGTLDDIVSNY